MSPVASAVRTSGFGNVLAEVDAQLERALRLQRRLLDASRDCQTWRSSVEGPIDDVHLLLAREPHEIDGIARDANRQVRILLRVIHRIEQRVAIEHVHVHVIAGAAEERVEDAVRLVMRSSATRPRPVGTSVA